MLNQHRVLRVAAAFLLAFSSLAAFVGNARAALQEGKDYELVTPAQATETGNKIEVLEVFWYGCPHCFALEPDLANWVKHLPKNAKFRRMPGVSNASWVPGAKTFYTFEAMGLTGRLHADMFNAIHVDGLSLDDDRTLFDWVGKHGVNPKQFATTYSSFSVQSKVLRAQQLGRAYGISGVPSIIVDGKYRTSPSMTGGSQNLFPVLDQLIQKAQQERAHK